MTIQGNVHPEMHGRVGLHEFRQVFVVSILQRKGSQVIGRMWLVGELVAGLFHQLKLSELLFSSTVMIMTKLTLTLVNAGCGVVLDCGGYIRLY